MPLLYQIDVQLLWISFAAVVTGKTMDLTRSTAREKWKN
jgi:hypothetical protein